MSVLTESRGIYVVQPRTESQKCVRKGVDLTKDKGEVTGHGSIEGE